LTHGEVCDGYKEQISALLEGGVDLIMVVGDWKLTAPCPSSIGRPRRPGAVVCSMACPERGGHVLRDIHDRVAGESV